VKWIEFRHEFHEQFDWNRVTRFVAIRVIRVYERLLLAETPEPRQHFFLFFPDFYFLPVVETRISRMTRIVSELVPHLEIFSNPRNPRWSAFWWNREVLAEGG
jgi:hypothetical protein